MSGEQFIVNEGDGAKLIPVESKESTLAVEAQKLHDKIVKNQELFASTPVIPVEKKKRGRPSKKTVTEEVKPEKIWYCSTCRETISDKNVMRIGAGDNGRCAVFCPQCTRSFGFEDQEAANIVAAWVKDNPTGK